MRVGCLDGFGVGCLDGIGVTTGNSFSAGGIHDGIMDGLHPIESSPGVGLGVAWITEISETAVGFGVKFVT